MFQLRTQRLILRDLTDEDLSLVRRMASEPAVTRYQTWLKLGSEAEARQWLQDAMFHNRQHPRHAYNLALAECDTRRKIGWIGWGHAEESTYGEYSFGYALLPEYWGQGYMTEALQAGIRFMFEVLGAQGVTDHCESTNIGSKRVMEKAGMRLVARWMAESLDGPVEHLRYAIQRSEWEQIPG
jgi:RimJ/RimL family protein N-acetyltransferase